MTTPNNCGVCNQSFESDRDLQEHQKVAHPDQNDKLLDSEQDTKRGKERERIA
jgi:hypothetical protein